MAIKPGKFRIVLEERADKPGTWGVQVESTEPVVEGEDVPDAGYIGMVLLGVSEVCLRDFVNATRAGKRPTTGLALPQGGVDPELMRRILGGQPPVNPGGTGPVPPVGP